MKWEWCNAWKFGKFYDGEWRKVGEFKNGCMDEVG